MDEAAETVGGQVVEYEHDPIASLKREAIDRMKISLLSASLDDPLSAVTAMKQVTLLRAYHQVMRIVQYLDLMDKLESTLYRSIDSELADLDSGGFGNITKLLAIQEKLQKSIIESNKLLTAYLDIDQYPAFSSVKAATPVAANVIDLDTSDRHMLRENAGAILSELRALESNSEKV